MQPTSPTASGKARRTRRELRLLLIVSAAMLAFGAVCWLAFPHATPIVKGWLGRRHLPALKQFTQEQDWKQAIREMQEASRWAPDDPDVLHASLDLIYRAEGDPRTMMALINRLRQTGAATPADLALLGRIHIRLGDLSKARDLLAQLPEQTLRQTAGLRLQADILAADGRPDEAADTLRNLLTNDPDNSEVLMELALADLSSNDPGRRESIRERLWKAAHSSARALDAIELLAQTRDLTAPRAKELVDLVEQAQGTGTAKANAHLKVLSAQMRVSPQLRNDILQAEIKRWSNRPPAETAPLLAWLADEREHALILRIVPSPMAARHTSLLPYYVSALRGEGKWQELSLLLKSGGIDTAFSAQKIRLWLAETQANLENDPTRAVQTLTRVFEEARRGENLAETLEAARLAEQLGQWELAERCYQALAVKHPNNRQSMLAKLYELAESQHDGPSMLKACASLLEQKPENAALQLQNLYLQMLIGTQIEIAQQKLQERSAANDGGKADLFHLVHALSAHRQGQPEKVRAALSKIARPENLPAGPRVVYASLLKDCGGDPGRVFRLVERVPPLLLLPEEKTFLQRAL